MDARDQSTSSTNIDEALASFGLSKFRPGQREVIESIVAGNDCLCVMPTGGGKSLCYQLPSLIRPGLTIVVSPLIALMKDQVDSLSRNGIPAALINSTLNAAEQQTRLEAVQSGKYKLIYVAPERLRNPRFLESIRATPIQLLAVDEAHCISQWGHDFRPDYSRIGQFREWLGGIQTVALTATATPRVRQDIMDVLGLSKPRQFMSGFARPNLHFGVVNCQSDREKDEELKQFLKRTEGSGIIYAASRKRCETLVDWIGNKLKLSAGAYHAGLMPDQRRVIQERFMKGQLRLIVATNAFGMGIDKPDLRFVIHYNMPGSLEAYYQEAGRAGRDGKQSACVLLYSYSDRYIQEFFIENNYPPRQIIQSVYEFLQQREEDPIELTLEEIREQMGLSVSPEAVGSCLQILSRTRVLERLEMGSGLAMLRINSNLPTLVELLPKEAKVKRAILRLLEKAVGDRRYEEVYLHPRWLLQQSGMDREALMRHLREISLLDDVDYVPPFRGRAIHFHKRDVRFDELNIDFENLRKRKEAELDRLNQVIQFAQSPLCRQATILNYFGDPNANRCGNCDRCQRQLGWPKLNLSAQESPQATTDTGLNSDQPQPGSPSPENDHRDTAHGESSRLEVRLPSNPATGNPATDNPATGNPATGNQQRHLTEQQSAGKDILTPQQKQAFLTRFVDAIGRIHGRLGKILISQYLCGSTNSKVQKLNLHRLGDFGMLREWKQTESTALLDLLLGAGILRQQEVNRNRPTVSVSPELSNQTVRDELFSSIDIPMNLSLKIRSLVTNATPAHLPPTQPPPVVPPKQPSQQEMAGKGQPISQEQPPMQHAMQADQRLTGGGEAIQSTFDWSGSSKAPPQPTESSHAPLLTVTKQLDDQQESPSESLQAHSKANSVGHRPDWHWSLELLRADYDWNSVRAIRRMSDEQLSADLLDALRAGVPIERSWLLPVVGDLRTPGQQRIVRELQRRATAGV